MSTFDSDDLETTGYFLPRDSQLRLKWLREYAGFLSYLAPSWGAEGSQERTPGTRADETAVCLALLARQIERVLDGISWPAYREGKAGPEGDKELEAAKETPCDADSGYAFGVTLEQIDTLNRLIDMIAAHGDVVMSTDDAGLADHTVSLLGHAIFNDAGALREIIDQVELQAFQRACSARPGVREECAVYRVGQARLPDVALHGACPPLPGRHASLHLIRRPALG